MDDRIKQIATNYGVDCQIETLKREMKELDDAVCEYTEVENTYTIGHLVEEMQDVKIVIDQLSLLLNQDLADWWRDYKLDRQIVRMENENSQSK